VPGRPRSIRDAAVEPALLEALRAEVIEVRLAAVQALGRAGSVASVPELLHLAEDAPRGLRSAARQAVARDPVRLPGAGPGQLSLAPGAAGALSIVADQAGALSVVTGAEGASKVPGVPFPKTTPATRRCHLGRTRASEMSPDTIIVVLLGGFLYGGLLAFGVAAALRRRLTKRTAWQSAARAAKLEDVQLSIRYSGATLRGRTGPLTVRFETREIGGEAATRVVISGLGGGDLSIRREDFLSEARKRVRAAATSRPALPPSTPSSTSRATRQRSWPSSTAGRDTTSCGSSATAASGPRDDGTSSRSW